MPSPKANAAATSDLQRALSLLLDAAAARLGVSVESCLASDLTRLAVCDAFSLAWIAIETAAEAPADARSLAEGLDPSLVAALRELNATGALELPPDDWQVLAPEQGAEPEATLRAAFLAHSALFGPALLLWLIEPKRLRRIVEAVAVALELTFRQARLPMRAQPLTASELSAADHALIAALFSTHAKRLPSHKVAKPSAARPAAGQAEPQGDAVQFTVYRPAAISPVAHSLLIAFAHLASKRPDAPDDEPEPAERARQQAAAILGPRMAAYRELAGDAHGAIPKESQLTFVPSIAGVEVFPREQHVIWTDDLHRVEFQLRARPELVGRSASGVVTIYSGPLIVGSIGVSMQVVATLSEGDKQRFAAAKTARAYDRIFASYSRADTRVVQAVRGIVSALGHRYNMDVTELRSGEVWSKRLEELIAEAQVFQLFWSQRSMRSPFVRREWEYALALNREGFIRPTFWEDPRPSAPEEGLPPPELDRLNFERLPLPAEFGAVTKSGGRGQPRMRNAAAPPSPTEPLPRSVAVPSPVAQAPRSAPAPGAAGPSTSAVRPPAPSAARPSPRATPSDMLSPVSAQQYDRPSVSSARKIRGLWPATTALVALLGIASVMWKTTLTEQATSTEVFSSKPVDVELDPDIHALPKVEIRELKDRTLRIETKPAGAYVYDQDKLLGRTPLELTKPQLAPRNLTIRAPDYQEASIVVTRDTKPLLEVELTPNAQVPSDTPSPDAKKKKKAKPSDKAPLEKSDF